MSHSYWDELISLCRQFRWGCFGVVLCVCAQHRCIASKVLARTVQGLLLLLDCTDCTGWDMLGPQLTYLLFRRGPRC